MPLRHPRRLPGFRFEVQSPPPIDVLPRLDVACLVGFAASGPLHRPVRVESVAQFEMIFGSDTLLAWDKARCEPVYAYLAPAVRAFFRNGGQRAWVIRVAGQAESDHFPISGLLMATFDDEGDVEELRPAYARARSPGSWADAVRVSASLLSRTVALTPLSLDPPRFTVKLTSPDELAVGDLLRLTFDEGYILLAAVSSIEADPSSPEAPNQYLVACEKAIWFKASWQMAPPLSGGLAFTFTHDSISSPIPATVPLQAESPVGLNWPTQALPSPIVLDLDVSYIDSPAPGSLLSVDFGSEQFWLRVDNVDATGPVGSPIAQVVRVTGEGMWSATTPGALPVSIDLAERLSFELWARAGRDDLSRLSDLTFEVRHLRCWDALPTDLQLFPESTSPLSAERAALWSEAANPRFPLAGGGRSNVLFLPVAMPIIPDYFLGPDPQVANALQRDGLGAFSASLFLDEHLAEVGVRDLINEADTLRYQTAEPHSLAGIYAALEIDEATLIAAPDAVHRRWSYSAAGAPPEPLPSEPLLRPEWWHFLGCDPGPEVKPVHEPEWGNFLNCDIRVISPPELFQTTPDPLGTFTLSWTQPEIGLTYILQEAARPDFKGAVEIYAGPDDHYTLYGHAPGIYYYRVRGYAGSQSSDWSNGTVASIGAFNRWVVEDEDLYSSAALLEIQHAVLRLCAARSDLFAVFALPEHFREDDVVEYNQILTKGSSGFFGPEEPRTLSFGAIYHPWLIGREENQPGELRRTPPDGAMAGVIARRTLGRGSWLAPANEFLKGVVALNPPIERGRWLDLQEAQLNLIRHEPKGFTALNNDTLASDEDLRPINVRRLLILLRRLALRLGATYVFEPNDAAFRRSVQRGFEAMLDLMFMRGAFAGDTAAKSYQVVTDLSVNSPASIDQGRFIIELRVAPSLPMRFMTIRLVQTGDRTLVMQER